MVTVLIAFYAFPLASALADDAEDDTESESEYEYPINTGSFRVALFVTSLIISLLCIGMVTPSRSAAAALNGFIIPRRYIRPGQKLPSIACVAHPCGTSRRGRGACKMA